jgi:lipopolysaccharide biosynthesis glycosyltransferase
VISYIKKTFFQKKRYSNIQPIVTGIKADFCFVFYITNDLFLDGVLKLVASMKENRTKYQMACMLTSEVTLRARNLIREAGVHLIELKEEDLIYSKRRDFSDRYKNESWMMFSKLNLYRLTEFKKVVYIDCDIICLDNCDELMNYNAPAFYEDNDALSDDNKGLSAGVMLVEPSLVVLEDILRDIDRSVYGGHTDQSLLQHYYKGGYTKLPQKYNLLYKVIKRKGRLEIINDSEQAKLLHFNGQKPWIESGHPMGWKEEKDIAYEKFDKNKNLEKSDYETRVQCGYIFIIFQNNLCI